MRTWARAEYAMFGWQARRPVVICDRGLRDQPRVGVAPSPRIEYAPPRWLPPLNRGRPRAVGCIGSPSKRHVAVKPPSNVRLFQLFCFVPFAPPEQPLRVAEHARAFSEFNLVKQRIRGKPRYQRGVRKIHDERRR